LAIPETLDPLDIGTILLQNVDKNLHPRKLESCVDIEGDISLKPHEISQTDAVKSFEVCF
jgi:hypothetical protein